MLKKVLKKVSGSVLIEVIITFVIFIVFVIPIYGWLINLDNLQTKSEHLILAKNIIHNSIEDERFKSSADRVIGNQTSTVSQLPGGQLTTILSETDSTHPSLLQLQLTLTWQEVGGTKQVEMATLINNI